MATYHSTGEKSFVTSAAVSAYRRVTINSSNYVAAAGATDFAIGYAMEDAASGDTVRVRLANAGGTFLVAANVAITAGSELYPAASGRVTGISTGLRQIGLAAQAATAQDDIIEMIPVEISAYHA